MTLCGSGFTWRARALVGRAVWAQSAYFSCRAMTHPRQFGCAFRKETGETPAKAIERLRIEAAYLRLQDGSEPVDVIVRRAGLATPSGCVGRS